MAVNVAPTKANLIKAKNALALSQKGFELLDKKRNVLIREIMALIDKAKDLHDKMDKAFAKAYQALMVANITLGIQNVHEIAYSIPRDEEFEILVKSVMGVDIPSIIYEKKELKPSYAFHRTNSALDIAVMEFQEIKYLIYELAEVENSIYKLAKEIEKTTKRANALDNIQIPKYEAQVKYIEEVLEEKEREEFFRLKRLKKG
ncbi:MAG: V-type ATP synthase subunit D [Epulopiscium sp.]|nr:V-type ATP synthase subunit D [Candidatus Epulonipiscium sp.]